MIRQAFSVIELLIVLGIMALLSGLLMPVISIVRLQAKEVACLAHLRQIGVASLAYAADNRGVVVPGRMTVSKASTPDYIQLYWEDLLIPYLAEGDAVSADRIVRQGCAYFRAYGNKYLPFPGGERYGTGYGFSTYLKAGEPDGWRILHADPKNPAEEASLVSLGKIVRFSRMSAIPYSMQRILLGDANDPFIESHLNLAEVGQFWKHDSERHRGRANYMFVDGHAGALAPLKAWYGVSNPGAAP
jgi:prepilin-type processing-associated H-X9-DG protein